jgi:peptidoglycan/LPS O-acetylase OafA/YrhL
MANQTQDARSPADAPAREHLAFLDGVRGFAALWVFISHALKFSGWTVPLLHRGDLAVDVFMIMSGFLMAYHYHLREAKEPWTAPSTWGVFYVRRFFRIAPLYYFALCLCLLLGPQLWSLRQQIGAVFPDAATPPERYLDRSWTNILTHLTFVFGVTPRYAFSTPLPDWSIGLEMQFYLVFPFLMLCLRRCTPLWGVGLLAGLGWLITRLLPYGTFLVPSFLPLKIGLFLVGMLLASAHHCRNHRRSFSVYLVFLALLAAATTRSWPVLGMCAGIVALLFYDRAEDPLRLTFLLRQCERVIAGRLASFMADTSYSVYLVHVVLMTPVAAALCRWPAYRQMPGAVRSLILIALVLPPVYLVGWGLFQTVEKNGIRLGKTLIAAFPRRSSGPT